MWEPLPHVGAAPCLYAAVVQKRTSGYCPKPLWRVSKSPGEVSGGVVRKPLAHVGAVLCWYAAVRREAHSLPPAEILHGGFRNPRARFRAVSCGSLSHTSKRPHVGTLQCVGRSAARRLRNLHGGESKSRARFRAVSCGSLSHISKRPHVGTRQCVGRSAACRLPKPPGGFRPPPGEVSHAFGPVPAKPPMRAAETSPEAVTPVTQEPYVRASSTVKTAARKPWSDSER